MPQRSGRPCRKLAEAEDARRQTQTIENDRQLLADPDPVAPLCEKLTQLLRREADRASHGATSRLHQDGMAALRAVRSLVKTRGRGPAAVHHWHGNGLTSVPGIKVGTEAGGHRQPGSHEPGDVAGPVRRPASAVPEGPA